jgi:hypothetical protein
MCRPVGTSLNSIAMHEHVPAIIGKPASVAQRIERLRPKESVGGSIPSRGTIAFMIKKGPVGNPAGP